MMMKQEMMTNDKRRKRRDLDPSITNNHNLLKHMYVNASVNLSIKPQKISVDERQSFVHKINKGACTDLNSRHQPLPVGADKKAM